METSSILLVDDEEQILKSVQREISPWLAQNQLKLLTALSGREALEIINKNLGKRS